MSTNEKQRVVEVLQELNEFVHDGLEGYERAAKESTDSLRQDAYRRFSQQRLAFANELNQVIQQHGGSPQRDTTAKGKLYRQWMDFKATIAGGSEEAILGSCIYGEEWAQKAYRDALDHELPAEIRGILLRQREASTDVLTYLHQLWEAAGYEEEAPSGLVAATAVTSTPNSTWRTALYVAAGAAGAALIYGLITKRIPTDRLMAGVSNLTKGTLGTNGKSTGKKKNQANR
ncbi:PA2169 family four-helix-bundle protein [Rufibacter sediminis]|uniref:PA2169 family four-helix-bundle protein n=1 Tax=Rufibacter sediminis TaxID=2762756 RepID=A0ABR6VZ24_9BACT|nr:PA2169 family four-helix-bundle protein [Rufibacter sediminis]MBC3542411.1 PA2169 family four-helix-bundle protein [Rufibacter sediminis]